MSKVRVCFLGTPPFALTSLKKVFEDPHYEIVGVITQPDRPAGRRMLLTPSPVKKFALEKGLRVISPDHLKTPEILEEVRSWGAEVAIVVAFGQILTEKFLNLFPLGAVNVHGSILPKWRGAAPIQRALQAGDTETGVTLQKIVKELDAGDIIGVRKVPITDKTDAATLFEELAILGADLLHVELMDYIRGNLTAVKQDPAGVTFAKKIEKSEAQLDWSESAVNLHNKVRAFNMGPGTWVPFQGKKIKIHKTEVVSTDKPAKPGTIMQLSPLVVATGDGALSLLELQPESRNRMSASDFLKSNSLKEGDLFG